MELVQNARKVDEILTKSTSKQGELPSKVVSEPKWSGKFF